METPRLIGRLLPSRIRKKKIHKGTKAKKPTSGEPRRKNGSSDNGLVIGQMTILRRGESLNSLTSKTKGGDSESTSPNQKPVEDLTVCIIAEEEMARREKPRDVVIFERLHGNPAKSSANLAVKKFCRTITARDVKASDVRPVSVLEATLNYLRNLLNSSEGSFEDMSQQPPWQKLVASDLHGNQWNFRHIFRGTCALYFTFFPQNWH